MRLRALGYRSYPAYLQSPQWANLRRRYWGSDEPQDCICGETEHLQLHHLTYERIGAENLSDLTPLCRTCHVMIHELERRGEIGLDFAGFVDEKRAARYQAVKRVEEPVPLTEAQVVAAARNVGQHLRAVVREIARTGQDPNPWLSGVQSIVTEQRQALRGR